MARYGALRRATPGAAPAHPAAAGPSQTRTRKVPPPSTGMAKHQTTRVQMPTGKLPPQAVPAIPGCPAGLEYLTKIDHLIVREDVDLCNTIMPSQSPSSYVVTNTMDQIVFKVTEDFTYAWRSLGTIRPFLMRLYDFRDAEVLRLDRPLRCDCSLCFCCLQTMDVRDASDATIGSLRMEYTLIYPKFSVLDSENNAVLLIIGPCCTRSICCEDVEFDIVTMDGVTKIGAITKVWGGTCREACTVADNFTITFPLDLEVKMKAVLLGAVMLLDRIYFEGGCCATCLRWWCKIMGSGAR
ncbi:phospholipid scramblase 3-like isoform X2 [Dermacentor albipictus]|uniref:phospholipid scramblase 3-like isoform X2 n=1 Tax=Dermacentor albipictus TaxID=60249 RepID=UPI0038FC83FD